jgi:hypothetical protein
MILTGIAFGTGFALLLNVTFVPEAVSTRNGAIDSMEAAKSGNMVNCGSSISSSGGGVRIIDFGREAIISQIHS